jgi:hypothetical protein
VGKKPTQEERIADLERRLAALDAEHEERIAAIEAACRAFAVVFAIPRITPGDEG